MRENLANKVWLKEISTNKEVSVDFNMRVVRAPKDFDVKKKGVDIVRDDGSLVHAQAEHLKYRLEIIEIQTVKIGERIFAKAGSSKLGSSYWPLFEVIAAPK
jgi:hypothetical protein